MSAEPVKQLTTKILFALTIVFLSIIGYLMLVLGKTPQSGEDSSQLANGVITQGNTQYIDITAKGGYTPSNLVAKANIETILRVYTSNTFDCSSAITIPSLNYRSNLPPSGTTEIKIPPQAQNTVLKGTCSMGMYRFSIKFI